MQDQIKLNKYACDLKRGDMVKGHGMVQSYLLVNGTSLIYFVNKFEAHLADFPGNAKLQVCI